VFVSTLKIARESHGISKIRDTADIKSIQNAKLKRYPTLNMVKIMNSSRNKMRQTKEKL
jgi:hypothetical protein